MEVASKIKGSLFFKESTTFHPKGNRRQNVASVALPHNQVFSILTEKLLQIKMNNSVSDKHPKMGTSLKIVTKLYFTNLRRIQNALIRTQ